MREMRKEKKRRERKRKIKNAARPRKNSLSKEKGRKKNYDYY